MVLKTRKYFFLLTAVLMIFCFMITDADCEEQFQIRRIGNINPYSENSFLVHSPEEGQLTIRVHDSICVYRTITQQITEGDTRITWDGCGYNQEKLYEKTYSITAELETVSGQHYSVSFASPIEYPKQCLQYALLSSYELYRDTPEKWFLEYRTVTDGTVCIELLGKEAGELLYTYTVSAAGAKIGRKDFKTIAGRKALPASGEFTIRIYEKSRPDQYYEYPLRVLEKTPEKERVTATGEIMPDRSMTDQEIWQLMMQPSVVVDIDFFKHQDIFEEPDEKSRSLGTLHGQTQGLKVIRTEKQWALIGAWNHEDASYVEGWVPYSKLKIEYPKKEYGILIDKQKQTLSVYRNGQKIDTLLISTGRAEKNKLYQETSAGCFLTGYHRVNFSMNGKKYDYVIQYDGGNLLHQTPYDWGQQKKDFTLGRGYLGAKASHACIRIQPEPGEGGLNAFWIFTHIPYHTRVIILDDEEKRENEKNLLIREKKADIDISVLHCVKSEEKKEETDVTITFGGCVTPGGSKAFNNKKGSFSKYLTEKGYDAPLQNVKNVFDQDDFTCINLSYINPEQSGNSTVNKGSRYAVDNMKELFKNASVDLIQIISHEYESGGNDSIKQELGLYASTRERDHSFTANVKGHLFGFTACSEKVYLRDPEVIDKRIRELTEKHCETIIFFAEWGSPADDCHSIVQEAMAHRCVRAGASLVIGNIKGRIQGADYIEGVPVFYSLGDLLDGSVSEKTKNQQGILLRAVFSFTEGKESPALTVIPIMPCGNTIKDKNEYCPATMLSKTESSNIFRYIWQDTPDQIMDRLLFSISY